MPPLPLSLPPLPVPIWDAPSAYVAMPTAPPVPALFSLGAIRAHDGALLRTAVYGQGERGTPVRGTPVRGTIVLIPGFTEFVEKYYEVISELLARDFAVVVMECRGHGLSQRALRRAPHRLHLPDFDINIADLEARWARVVAPMPQPHFLLAHSMGGLIGLRAIGAHPEWVAAFAASAPMLGLPIPWWGAPLLRGFVRGAQNLGLGRRPLPWVAPSRAMGRLPANAVTSDEARFLRNEAWMQHCPALLLSQVSLGWIAGAGRAMQESAREEILRALATPAFFGIAEDERVVSSPAIARAASFLPHAQTQIYAGARHEIMMERDNIRRAFLDDVTKFFLAQSS